MKNSIIVTALFLFNVLYCVGQDLKPAPGDKAVVYFVRPSSMGFAINFSYFDDSKLIGRFKGAKYIRYECEPGVHLFWARSENKDFVEAEVEAGKIYFIEAKPKMGFGKAGVELFPLDTKNSKKMGKIFKLLNKKPSESFTEEELKEDADDLEKVVERGLEKYKEEKASGKVFAQLKKSMFYSNQ